MISDLSILAKVCLKKNKDIFFNSDVSSTPTPPKKKKRNPSEGEEISACFTYFAYLLSSLQMKAVEFLHNQLVEGVVWFCNGVLHLGAHTGTLMCPIRSLGHPLNIEAIVGDHMVAPNHVPTGKSIQGFVS